MLGLRGCHRLFFGLAGLVVGCDEGIATADGCEIVSEHVVRLGGDRDEENFARWPSVSPLVGEGFFLGNAPHAMTRQPPAVFNSTGHYLRALGPLGDGPGEYRDPVLFLRYRGDSTLVVDATTRRIAILDRSLRMIRVFPVTGNPLHGVVLDGGRLAIADVSIPTLHPVRILDPDGTVVATLGLRGPPSPARDETRLVARRDSTTLWLLPLSGEVYEFEAWSHSGSQLSMLAPVREWFPAARPRRPPTPTQMMSPLPTGLWQDSTGHLWATLVVADADWQKGLGPATRGEGGREYFPIVDRRRAQDGLVDVIDTATGASIASRRFDLPIIQVLEPGLISLGDEGPDGWWRMELVRLSLSPGCAGARKN